MSVKRADSGSGGGGGEARAAADGGVVTDAPGGESDGIGDGDGNDEGDDDPPGSKMLFLQLFFMCMSWAPSIGFSVIGALVLDNAPAHLMGWSHAPIAAMSFLAHWIVTVELSETPGWLEEVRPGL